MEESNLDTMNLISEFACSPDDFIYRVLRPFYLEVEDGPGVPLRIGQLVRLRPRTAELFYAGKIEPYAPDIPDRADYEALRAFTVAVNGQWMHVRPGDIISLSRDEALLLFRARKIKSTNGEFFLAIK